MVALTKSLIGEMQFCVRTMHKKKSRERDGTKAYIAVAESSELPRLHERLSKQAGRVERLKMCLEWLDEQEKQHG